MSGGSYNYIYSRLSEECENRMYDAEMNDLIKDLCIVLHDLEWWESGDSSEERYRKTLSTFKKKWFKGDEEGSDDAIDILNESNRNLLVRKENAERALRRIRFEVEDNADYYDAIVNADIAKGLYLALQIIDKEMKGAEG